jgi:hypothetical protein
MRPFYLPLFTEAMSLFSAFALLPELLQSLARPYSKGFSVTPKGNAASDTKHALFQQTILPREALNKARPALLADLNLTRETTSHDFSA